MVHTHTATAAAAGVAVPRLAVEDSAAELHGSAADGDATTAGTLWKLLQTMGQTQ